MQAQRHIDSFGMVALLVCTLATGLSTRTWGQAVRADDMLTAVVPDSIAELHADSAEVLDEFAITPDSVLLRRIHPTIVPPDAANVVEAELQDAITRQRQHFMPDPIRALWLGLVLPGGGQIYNRKYWKLPIVYGGFLGCAYALSWNNQMLSDYSQAYLDIMDDDPDTKSYEKMLPLGYDITGREEQFKEIFKNKKNYYRKYRDMSIFAFAAVYIISVIDAYVDAELSSFDISDDLTLKLTPAVIDSKPVTKQHIGADDRSHGWGLAFHLNF